MNEWRRIMNEWRRIMNETMELIQKLSNERSYLYRLAGKQHLTPEQQYRLNELGGRVYVLWDTHRRELAASHRYVKGEKLYKELEAA